MDRPLISVLHPTARVKPNKQFPRGWRDAHDAWLARADHPERIEYVLAVHESRFPEALADVVGDVSLNVWCPFHLIQNFKRDCVVDQTNCAAEASSGQILIGAADDYYPPEHWDTVILEAFEDGADDPDDLEHLVDHPYILHFSTGAGEERDKALMIGGAWTRPVYDLYGYILDPDFESMFADNWYAHCARRDHAAGKLKIIERLDILFDHRHPIFGKNEMDEVYALQNREEAYKMGELTYLHKVTGKPIVLCCFPGENFSSNMTQSRLNLLFGLAGETLPVPAWNYSSNVYATRMEMARWALEFRPKAKYILWADDDNEVTVQQASQLAQDLKDHPELGVVTGFCWCDNHEEKSHELQEWSLSCGRQRWSDLQCNRFRGDDIMKALRGNGLITSKDIEPHVFWSGFPLVLMRYEALEAVGAEAFRARTSDPEMLACLRQALPYVSVLSTKAAAELTDRIDAALARAEVIASCKFGQTSEDTSFFMACHEKGIQCAVDVRVEVPHIKPRAIRPQFIPASQVAKIREEIGDTSLQFGPLNMLGEKESPVGAD